VTGGGADGIVVHKGRARMIPTDALTGCGLVVHLSASTAHSPDANAKVLVGDVDEAIRLGADAVSVHVNLGSDTEAAQLADLGMIASACDRWGIPLMAMIYPRGPRVDDPTVPELISHAANIAADLGADLVKTPMAKPAERMAEVAASSPLPIVVAGGGDRGQPLPRFATSALSSGCRGLAVGRRVFTSPAPAQAVRELAAIVHSEQFSSESIPYTRMAGVL
jgi:2-amino-4,5-dihydroxy-6-oxo-7-(phosphonooxy)heptanoate synthase